MKKLIATTALMLGASGCLGPNNLYNGLNNWNANVTDQDWADELIFLGLHIIPVYGITLFADILVINTIDYWSGENPVKDPGPFPHEAFGK